MLLTPSGIANRCFASSHHLYPAFIVQFAELNVQTATPNDQCAELNVQSGTLNVQLATFNVQDGTSNDQLAKLNVQDGTSNVGYNIPAVHGSITPFHFLTSNK